MTCELICVDPKRVHEFWPFVEPMIRSAVTRVNISNSRDIEYYILNGDALLWLAWDGQTIRAAAATHIVSTDTNRDCVLSACGGKNMQAWLPLLQKIEAYAKAEGCKHLRIYGRKGWVRLLKDYQMKHVILEKELN